MNNMRRGFTMIELIFVIVIIGILAAVAIPKLAATRDSATASTCTHEIGGLVQEIGASYTSNGYAKLADLKWDSVTNIPQGKKADGAKGFELDPAAKKVSDAMTYNCDGKEIVKLTLTDGNLKVEPGADKATALGKLVIDGLSGSVLTAKGEARDFKM